MNNFNDLKEGDAVILRDHPGDSTKVVRVERRTPTTVIIPRGRVFSIKKEKGGMIMDKGDSWHWQTIELPTPEGLEAVRNYAEALALHRVTQKIKDELSATLTKEQAVAIGAVLNISYDEVLASSLRAVGL